jgi:hypothetical protein
VIVLPLPNTEKTGVMEDRTEPRHRLLLNIASILPKGPISNQKATANKLHFKINRDSTLSPEQVIEGY